MINLVTTASLLMADTYRWKGGVPGGYEILDSEGNRLMLYFSEDQAQVHMSLATILKSLIGKKTSEISRLIDDEITVAASQYLDTTSGVFLAPQTNPS